MFRISPSGEFAVTLATVSQFAFIAIIQISALILFLKTSRAPIWLMIVYSPAAGLFGLLNPDALTRKEIIPIAAIALMAVIFRGKFNPFLYAFPLLILAIGSFSHETSNFSVPAFIYLLFLEFRNNRITSKAYASLAALALIPAALGVAITVRSPGTIEQVSQLCMFFTDRNLSQMCYGPVSYLDNSLIDGMNELSLWFPNYLAYIPALALATLPIALLRPNKSIWLLLLTIYVFLIPLFLTGIDYGRWVYLATSLITFVLLATWNQSAIKPINVPLYAAILFISLWLLPYTGNPDYRSLVYLVLEQPVNWFIEFLAETLNPTK